MSAKLLDGKILAAALKESLKKEVEELKKKFGRGPVLASVIAGDDAAASAYANSQKKTADYIGIEYKLINLPSDISQKEFLHQIGLLNADKTVSGILILNPTPPQIDYAAAMNHVGPSKEIEGVNAANIGKMVLTEAKIIPCTPASVMEHIKSTGVKLRGKEAVVVGRSEIVGKPVSLLLLAQSATVTICHSGTSDAGTLADHVRRADIVVAAVGKAGFIKGEWIKEGAIVIDVGINKVNDKIVGDVEFETAQKKAGYITPVPGGVGPLTVVMLMKNCIEAFKEQRRNS